MSDFIRTKGTSGLLLQEYKGEYSLASAYESQSGKVILKWAKDQKGRDEYAEKATPVKVQLGDKQTAVAALKMIMAELQGQPNDMPPWEK
jgi:hypothetical protein